MEYAQRTIFKQEVVDVQLRIGIRLVEERLHYGFSCGFSCKIHRVEIDEVEDVCHIHVLQICHDRVFRAWRSLAVDDDMLVVVLDREVIY